MDPIQIYTQPNLTQSPHLLKSTATTTAATSTLLGGCGVQQAANTIFGKQSPLPMVGGNQQAATDVTIISNNQNHPDYSNNSSREGIITTSSPQSMLHQPLPPPPPSYLHRRRLSKHLSFVMNTTPPTTLDDFQQPTIFESNNDNNNTQTTTNNNNNTSHHPNYHHYHQPFPNRPLPPLQIPTKSASVTAFPTLALNNKKKKQLQQNLNVQLPTSPIIMDMPFSILKGTTANQPPLQFPQQQQQSATAASICSSASSSPSTISTCSVGGGVGVSGGIGSRMNQQQSSHTIESGLIENMTSKKKRGTTRENIILLDSILRERRDIFYAILNNVTKIRLYRKKRRVANPMQQHQQLHHQHRSGLPAAMVGPSKIVSSLLTSVSGGTGGTGTGGTTTTTTTDTLHYAQGKEEFGNEYIVKLNNGLKCEAFETSTAQEYENYGHKRQFKASMYYTQNEMDRLENQSMMDPSPLLREDKLSFLDQLHGLHNKPSVQSYRVIDLIHPYHLFSTEMEIIEPKSGRDLGRIMKKSYSLRTQYLVQTIEGVKKHSNGAVTSHDKYKYSTLFTITKQKASKKDQLQESPNNNGGNNKQHILDQFQVRNDEGENVALITHKFNADYELKGYNPDYMKVNFLMETTPFERTLILSSLFLLDIEYFGH